MVVGVPPQPGLLSLTGVGQGLGLRALMTQDLVGHRSAAVQGRKAVSRVKLPLVPAEKGGQDLSPICRHSQIDSSTSTQHPPSVRAWTFTQPQALRAGRPL